MDRIAGSLGYTRARPRQAQRAFAAAANTRLNLSFPATNTAFDYDLRASLKALRGRSRYLAQNNDYARRFLQMCVTHIAGPNGFALQSQVKFDTGKPDLSANAAIERAFMEWASRGVCEASGRLSFVDLQQLLIETTARDGEFLVRKVYKTNRFGYALQVVDVDRLDVDRNEVMRNGHRVSMGVELDTKDVPVAYWLLRRHPGSDDWSNVDKWERVPAEDVFHGFRASRPEQTRGVPWMHTAMSRMQHLAGFEEAAVVAARVGAAKMGFFTSPDGSVDPIADGKDAAGIPYQEADPGTFGMLPAGYSFQPFNPDYPSQAFDPFVKATLRGIASGLGVAYHTLASDLEGVNFSSARAGTLEERDNWMAAQEWFASAFLYPMFSDWLRWALASGAITFANGSPLPALRREVFDKPLWQGRRWSWVDPLKDVEANIQAINAGLKSRREVVAEQGRDIDDVWLQLQAEDRRAQELGLDLEKKPPVAPAGDAGKVNDEESNDET